MSLFSTDMLYQRRAVFPEARELKRFQIAKVTFQVISDVAIQ